MKNFFVNIYNQDIYKTIHNAHAIIKKKLDMKKRIKVNESKIMLLMRE